MDKNKMYKILVDDIKSQEYNCDINIYCGKVNGTYRYDLVGQNMNSDCIDTLKSNGKVLPEKNENDELILSVENADYVVISTIKYESETNEVKTVRYSVIFDPPAFGYFQSYLLSNNENELFEKATSEDYYLKGNLSTFKVNEINESKGIIIYPITEKEKKLVRTI